MISLKQLSTKKREQGFTIVELLIVIVVIGILALLVITTYSGIQQKARNAKRQTDIASVQTQLEAFFQNNGYYPSLKDMQDTTQQTGHFVNDNMKSLDLNALIDPSNPTHSDQLQGGTGAGVKNSYEYDPTNDAGTSCEADHTTCSKYTLIATFEGNVNGQATAKKSNLD